uniref:Uncharacterized protein n=1 Tax=Ditylenchus dipsaci TaxID=166011 RepID=A0A915E105_9BILA
MENNSEHQQQQSAPSSLQNQQQSSSDSTDTSTENQSLAQQQVMCEDGGLNHSCEVCMAEAWWKTWKMASYQHNLFQQQQQQSPENSQQTVAEDESQQQEGYIGSFSSEAANTGMPENNSQFAQRFATAQCRANGMVDNSRQADFSMPKLKEFFEIQKALGVPNFPENFDDFWLLVVKARLFNVFKYKGPEVYNRIVLKIREIVRKVMAQVEERESREQQLLQ